MASVWLRKSKRKLSALHHFIHANNTVVGVGGVDEVLNKTGHKLTDKAGATQTRRLILKAAFGTSGATCTTSPDHMKKKKSKKGGDNSDKHTTVFPGQVKMLTPQKSA